MLLTHRKLLQSKAIETHIVKPDITNKLNDAARARNAR
jgi:hypothetical protein